MLKNQNDENIFFKMVSDSENYMESLRDNIGLLRTYYGWSVRVLAEKANISEDTLQTFLKGKSKDCNLSTAIKIAKAFGVSIDELVGAGTINPVTKESMQICRLLPQHFLYLVRTYIRHVYKLFLNKKGNEPRLVMLPECTDNRLHTTNITKLIDIGHLDKSIISRVAHGLRIPCDHYEPYFMPEEILLLGVDRDALDGETCVISHHSNYYIVKKKQYIENGLKKWKYISLFTEKEILKEDIDEKLGYVVGFLYPDGSWGER